MISLRKYIDGHRGDDPSVHDLLREYRAILIATGRCADRAVPLAELEMSGKMGGFEAELAKKFSVETLARISQQAGTELNRWADAATARRQESERELHEIIAVIANAAESLRGRDARYAKEITDLSVRLNAIAEEKELAPMRRSIIESTRAFKDCVARMAEDSKASVDQLTAEMQDYRTRLAEAERASQTDSLTNLANRRAFEINLNSRIAGRKPFCVIMIDLNGFKSVNDSFGHLAGDDLLRQFAGELRAQFTSSEMVARWGGDEFIVVASGRLNDVRKRVENMRKWALGEYKIRHKDSSVKVELNAAIGVAEWNGIEHGLDLLARADREVYRSKNMTVFSV